MRTLRDPHRCPLPGVYGRHGVIVQCECGQAWRSVAPGNPAYEKWRRVSKLGLKLRGLA